LGGVFVDEQGAVDDIGESAAQQPQRFRLAARVRPRVAQSGEQAA
jgi:hypothetical protein